MPTCESALPHLIARRPARQIKSIPLGDSISARKIPRMAPASTDEISASCPLTGDQCEASKQ
jgi:hypothetical protein